MTEQTPAATTQVFRIYIEATPERIWEAITSSDFTNRYGYGGDVEFDLRPGGAFRNLATAQMKEMGYPDVVVTGEVLECDPPRRLVQTWDPVWLDEPATTLTYEIEPSAAGSCRLTLTHELAGAPETARQVAGAGPAGDQGGGGWPWILSGLKTLVESGREMEPGSR